MSEQGDLYVAGQSDPLFVPSVMKTHILLTDDPAQEDLLQRYQERIEKVITTRSADQNFVLMQDS